MIFFYRIVTNLLYPILILLIYIRKILEKEDPIRFKEKIFSSHFNVQRLENKKLIWFHCASVGELKSIIPIIKEIDVGNSDFEFLITTVTLSSANLARSEIKKINNVSHRFFPIDVHFLIKKFISSWKPNVIFLVDSEIWPNLIISAKRAKIPIALINARITRKTFKRWMYVPKLAEKIFRSFDLCLSSNLETKQFLENLKAKNIVNAGNIKLIKSNNLNLPRFEKIKNQKIWCALSTHEGEEKLCIKVHKILSEKFKDVTTIIAPRHIERSSKIKKLCVENNLNVQIIGKDDNFSFNKEVVIINSFGILFEFLLKSRSVFIGKSTLKRLENDSGQSPIEPAQLGCRIYHGPYVSNFKDIYEILNKNKIAKEINTYEELSNNLMEDFEKKIEKKPSLFMQDLSEKTLENTMKYLNKFLSNENIKTEILE